MKKCADRFEPYLMAIYDHLGVIFLILVIVLVGSLFLIF